MSSIDGSLTQSDVGDADGLLDLRARDRIGSAIYTRELAVDCFMKAALEGGKADILYIAAMRKMISRIVKLRSTFLAGQEQRGDFGHNALFQGAVQLLKMWLL